MWYTIRKGNEFKIVCCADIQTVYPGWAVVEGPCKKQTDLFSTIVHIIHQEALDDQAVLEVSVSQHD